MRLSLSPVAFVLGLAATAAMAASEPEGPRTASGRPRVTVNGDVLRIAPAQRYPAARSLLLESGFEPVPILDNGSWGKTQCGRAAREPCRTYPELDSCASDAPRCSFLYRRRSDGSYWSIGSEGEWGSLAAIRRNVVSGGGRALGLGLAGYRVVGRDGRPTTIPTPQKP